MSQDTKPRKIKIRVGVQINGETSYIGEPIMATELPADTDITRIGEPVYGLVSKDEDAKN